MKNLNFSHNYKKLQSNKFTTIRGESKFLQFRSGQIVRILLEGRFLYNAYIDNLESAIIQEIPLELLKRDVEYDGFTINSHMEFVNGLNRIRLEHYNRNNINLNNFKRAYIDSKVTIFYLSKVNELSNYFQK